MVDLDASMSRLLLSSKKSPTSSPPPDALEEEEEEEEEAVAALGLSRSSSDTAERVAGVPVDSVSQVDQFLREALEKPRERLASELLGLRY